MDNNYSVQKRKLSPVALTGIIAGGVVLITAIVLVSYFAFFRSESLIGSWHDEEETCQYTFYEDNKMIVDTPYGNFIGTYVFDKESGEGMISMDSAAIDFSFEKGKVTLSNGTELKRGRIRVVPMTTVPTTATETTLPETTAGTVPTETTVPPTTAAATAAPTTAAPAATTTVAPAATTTVALTSLTTIAPIGTIPTFSFNFNPSFPTYYIVGTPVVGQWKDDATGMYLLDFSDAGICSASWGTILYDTAEYEYNFFTGEGTMTLSTNDYEFSVSGDLLLLKLSGSATGQLFSRES